MKCLLFYFYQFLGSNFEKPLKAMMLCAVSPKCVWKDEGEGDVLPHLNLGGGKTAPSC